MTGELLEQAGGTALLLPTAAAYERPERAVEAAGALLARLGGRLEPCPILRRGDAEQREHAMALRRARLVLLADGSSLHLRAVLKDSAALSALLAAWRDGAAVLGAGAGAAVLSDPMVDPRGGALSVGLGFVQSMAAVPCADRSARALLERTVALATTGCAIVALPAGGAAVRDSSGSWRHAGSAGGQVEVYLDGSPAGLADLAGKPTA